MFISSEFALADEDKAIKVSSNLKQISKENPAVEIKSSEQFLIDLEQNVHFLVNCNSMILRTEPLIFL